MNTQIDLKRLQHLVFLAEEQNFTRAAERANLSQTAFSRSIQALEAGFGLRVFDRDTRSVQLSMAGRQLVERARALLANARDFANEIDGIAKADGGVLSIGVSLLAVDGALHDVLPLLRQRSPRLAVNIQVGNWQLLHEHLEQERIEFFIARAGFLGQDSRFTVIPLAPQPASIYCRAGHPLTSPENAPPRSEQLLEYPWAAAVPLHDLADTLRSLFGAAPGTPLPFALTCAHQALLREAMLTSDTLLLTWSAWLQADLHAGAVVNLGERLYPQLPREAMQLDCAIVYLSGRTLSPGALRLIELILNSAQPKG